MKQYYECHVTFTNKLGLIKIPGWTYSCIDGDPNLGAGVKSYATAQFKESLGLHTVISYVEEAADILRGDGHEVLRTKVELVVHDSRQDKVSEVLA